MGAAWCGRDGDAAEFLARYLAAAQSTTLDDAPAVDVIRAAPDDLLASMRGIPALNEAIGRVLARDEAAVPDDMQVNSGIGCMSAEFEGGQIHLRGAAGGVASIPRSRTRAFPLPPRQEAAE